MYSPIEANIQISKSGPTVVPYNEHLLASFSFLILGILSACPWNAIPNVLYTVVYDLYDMDYVTESPIIINDLIIIGFIAYFAIFGGVRPGMLKWTCLIFGLILLLISIILFFSLKKSTTLQLIVFIITVRFTLYMNIIFTIGLSISSILPFNYNGLITLGAGISSVFTFGSFILYKSIFGKLMEGGKLTSGNLLIKYIWFFGSAVVFCFLASILFSIVMSKKWFKNYIEAYSLNLGGFQLLDATLIQSSATSPTESFNDDSDSSDDTLEKDFSFSNLQHTQPTLMELQPARPTLFILHDSWQHIFNSSMSILTTLTLFPLISPFSWDSNETQELEITLFLLADLLGRFSALILPQIPAKKLVYGTIIRIIMIPISIPFIWNTLFNTLILRLIFLTTLSFSNGFIMTHSIKYAPESVHRIKEKAKVSAYNILSFNIFITLGLYSSQIYQHLLKKYSLGA